jgi:hypothetical protein
MGNVMDSFACSGSLSSKWEWLKLVNYGQYSHRLGIQVVSRESAREMADKFSTLWSRLARKFRGVPVYIGHPDDAEFSGQAGHGDTRAYGWVQQLDARDDGLWIRIRWSPAGIELLHNAYYKFLSPRWEMKKLDGNMLRPNNLLSVGLTNCPNLSVEAIANEKSEPQKCRCAPSLFPSVRSNSSEKTSTASAGRWKCHGDRIPVAANTLQTNDLVESRPAVSMNLRRRLSQGWKPGKWAGHQLLTLVNERMASTNENYADAWRSVRETHPALFDESMSQTSKKMH